ncbi:MAG: hypothetical protein PUK27_01460 [Prevotellaceae bacterium]|nr:hypothetical protein [Prevotellaceae bacterium]
MKKSQSIHTKHLQPIGLEVLFCVPTARTQLSALNSQPSTLSP